MSTDFGFVTPVEVRRIDEIPVGEFFLLAEGPGVPTLCAAVTDGSGDGRKLIALLSPNDKYGSGPLDPDHCSGIGMRLPGAQVVVDPLAISEVGVSQQSRPVGKLLLSGNGRYFTLDNLSAGRPGRMVDLNTMTLVPGPWKYWVALDRWGLMVTDPHPHLVWRSA